MDVEQVDFVSVPTRDVERAVAWYRESGVCHMCFVEDPDGNVLVLHRRSSPRVRTDG
jgi:hypothetical protein